MRNIAITIAIPLYNGADFVAETIESVLNQSYGDFEIIISDDGSTDASLEIVRRYSDSRIHLDEHDHLGIAANWNRCLSLARGKYMKLLPQDDLLYSDCIQESVSCLERCTSPSLFFSRRDILFDSKDSWSSYWARRHRMLDLPLQPLQSVEEGTTVIQRWASLGFAQNCIGEPVATMFPVALAKSIQGFAAMLNQNLDYAFWIRMLARGQMCFSPQELCAYRFHSNNATYANRSVEGCLPEYLRLIEVLRQDQVLTQDTCVREILNGKKKSRNGWLKRMVDRPAVGQVFGPVKKRFPDATAVLAEWLFSDPSPTKVSIADRESYSSSSKQEREIVSKEI